MVAIRRFKSRLTALPGPAALWLALSAAALSWMVWAAPRDGGHGASLWLGLGGIVLFGKAGGEIAVRLKQPPVLGELLAGVVLGNLDLVGVPVFERLAGAEELQLVAEIGIVLLLFQAGLETSIRSMATVAASAARVAVIGVVTPMALGVAISALLMSDTSPAHHLFVGATLAATSIGITARILRDRNALGSRAGRIVLGAAALDDILGLVVLALVSSLVGSATLSPGALVAVVASPAAFLIVAAVAGIYVMPRLFILASRLIVDDGWLAAMAVGICFAFAGLASAVGLAPIVGAFAAGLLLDDSEMRPFGHRNLKELSHLVAPAVTLLSPVFFARIGMAVDFSVVTPGVLLLAFALTAAAVVGKLVAGLGVKAGIADRLTVGIAMIPRGEVGLIFALEGARLLEGAHPVLDDRTFAAVVMMVVATTLLAPGWLGRRLTAVSPRTSRPLAGREPGEH